MTQVAKVENPKSPLDFARNICHTWFLPDKDIPYIAAYFELFERTLIENSRGGNLSSQNSNQTNLRSNSNEEANRSRTLFGEDLQD